MKSYKHKFFNVLNSASRASIRGFVYKSISHNQILEVFFRLISNYSFSRTTINNLFLSRLKVVCSISGRSRGSITKFGLSRLSFKEYCSSAKIFGFKKSKWLVLKAFFLHDSTLASISKIAKLLFQILSLLARSSKFLKMKDLFFLIILLIQKISLFF